MYTVFNSHVHPFTCSNTMVKCPFCQSSLKLRKNLYGFPLILWICSVIHSLILAFVVFFIFMFRSFSILILCPLLFIARFTSKWFLQTYYFFAILSIVELVYTCLPTSCNEILAVYCLNRGYWFFLPIFEKQTLE